MTVTLSCTDSETHVPSAVTRPRWASRCACGQAPTKWAQLHWESANLLILDSAIQKSNGSPRKREARFCMACSYGWSKNRLERGYRHHLPRYEPNLSAAPLRRWGLSIVLLPKLIHLCMFQTYFCVCSVLKEGDDNPQRQRHCLHFMFRTLVGDF